MEENFITIKNDFYINSSIRNEDLVVLALIMKSFNSAKCCGLCSVNLIIDWMYVQRHNNRIVKVVKEAIENLILNKFITILDIHYKAICFDEVSNSNLFYICTERLEEKYFKVLECDLDKIFKYISTTNINKFAFVRYFIAIQRVISSESEIGWLTQKQVRDLVGESRTVSNYNKILQDDLQLIFFDNNYVTRESRYFSTFFGRYDDDKSKFTKRLEIIVSQKDLIYTDKINSNKKRSVKQKINKAERELKDKKIKDLEDKIRKLEDDYENLRFKPKPKIPLSEILESGIFGEESEGI